MSLLSEVENGASVALLEMPMESFGTRGGLAVLSGRMTPVTNDTGDIVEYTGLT
jgi:hypothetical protein